MASDVTTVKPANSPRYALTMPTVDNRSVGNGPKQSAMWLDGVPCIVKGFHEWPIAGDRLVIDEVP